MFQVRTLIVIHFAVLIWLAVFHRSAEAQMTKIKVAYPTTVGSRLISGLTMIFCPGL